MNPTKQDFSTTAARRNDAYDPFVRGRFPVGVRTIQALDTARSRLFPCEIWYPAAAKHAGEDTVPGTLDFFTVPPYETQRSQSAVRDAAVQPGIYPLIVYSHGVASIDGWPRSFVLT